MVEWQGSQPEAERFIHNSDQTLSTPMVNWGADEKGWSQGPVCRQVGNQIVCDDIYGDNKPTVARVSFSPQGTDNIRSFVDLQMSMGLLPQSQVVRVSDTQVPPYYSPNAPQQGDRYSYNQGPRFGQIGVTGAPVTGVMDPYSFYQGDKSPIVPINPEIIPPYIKTGGQDVPLPPIPHQVDTNKPTEVPPPPKPVVVPQPHPTTNPYQTCQTYNNNPCHPCHPGGGRHWYPGMIAGRVLGRIFGGRGRCR